MSILQVIILAVVQGLTEFLPVSSSAHLALAPWLFGWDDPGLAFDIALHLGTFASVLIYFFKDWVQVIAQGFGIGSIGKDAELAKNRSLLWMLAVASLPIGFFGFLFNKEAETTWRSPYIIGTMLILIGLLMALAERMGKQTRDIGSIGFLDSILIGLSQALAIVPGTSRSGITITTGLFRDLNRESAARFSFLLSTPAIAAAAAKAFYDLLKHGGLAPDVRLQFGIGIVVSALVGCVVIGFFLKYLRHHTLKFFVYYRIVFGIMVIALASFFRHPAV
ncbi:MAG: undecaprenyl-diphosphatase UppP [Bryobacteraceae bacterium]